MCIYSLLIKRRVNQRAIIHLVIYSCRIKHIYMYICVSVLHGTCLQCAELFFIHQYMQPCLSKNPKYTFYEIESSLTLAYCENRNDPDLVQAFLKKWWVESDFKAPNLPLSSRLKGSGCHYSSIYNNT
jgi:hypothetical protein